jgi:hypothetical protein
LLSKYNTSPSLLITTTFPEYKLLPWKFEVCPKDYWNKVENQRNFMNWATEQLNIKEPSDWYKITQKVRKFRENSKFQGFSKNWRGISTVHIL